MPTAAELIKIYEQKNVAVFMPEGTGIDNPQRIPKNLMPLAFLLASRFTSLVVVSVCPKEFLGALPGGEMMDWPVVYYMHPANALEALDATPPSQAKPASLTVQTVQTYQNLAAHIWLADWAVRLNDEVTHALGNVYFGLVTQVPCPLASNDYSGNSSSDSSSGLLSASRQALQRAADKMLDRYTEVSGLIHPAAAAMTELAKRAHESLAQAAEQTHADRALDCLDAYKTNAKKIVRLIHEQAS